MTINGKPKTPLSAAQSKKTNGDTAAASTGKSGGTKARASRTSQKATNGVKSSVLERINDGILALDSGLNYTYLNERAGELLDCEAADLIGRSVWEAHPDVKGAPFAEACRRALETQTIVTLEGYFPAADRWLEGRVYPSEDGVSILFTEGAEKKQEDNRREERYRILFDTMQEGFLLAEVVQEGENAGADCRFLEVNASMAHFLGRSRDELIGRCAREMLPLDRSDLDTLQRACRVAAGQEEPFFVEKHDEASGHWLRGHIFTPKPGQFASLLSDVTEQRLAEAGIRDVSRFPGENPNPILRFTRSGEILYANPASRSLLEAWNQRADHTTPLGEIQGLLPAVLEEGENTEVDIANNGTFYTGLLVPVQEQGYINLYLRDITERRQIEENLHAHIHQTNAGITRADPEGRFTFVNQAFCNMLGYSEAELIGQTIWGVSHQDDVTKNKRLFERMMREGEPFQLEKRLVRRNGTILWINVGTSPLRDASGRIVAATSIIVDITRRKRAEEALLDSARRSLYLSALSDAIRPLSDPDKIQSEVVRLLGKHLRASRVAYIQVEQDGSALVCDSYEDGLPEISGQFELSACVPADQLSTFRAGRTVYASDILDDSRFSGTQKACQEEMSSQAQILVPFIRDGRAIAALCIQQSQPRTWKNEELALVEQTAERLQTAIERARAERDLRESEERLRLAGHAAGMCTWELNLHEHTYKLGDNFAEVLGFPADLLPENSIELTEHLNVKDDLLAMQETIKQVVQARGELPPLQFRVVNPLTKDILWLEVNAKLVYDKEGRPQRMFGMVQNITERKTVEEILRAKEAELEEIIHHTPFLLTRCTRDLRYRFVSRAYAEMINRTPEEVIGRTISEVMSQEGVDTLLPHIEKVLQGERVEFEIKVPFQGATVPWLHVVYTPDRDEHGSVVGWFASIVDITERRQMEEAIRESEERFRAIISQTTAGIAQSDLDGRFSFVNPRFCEMLGYPEQELTGKTIWELTDPQDREENRHLFQRLLHSGKSYQFEKRFIRKDGSPLWTNVSVSAIHDESGRPRGGVGVIIDIEERKHAEASLREYARQQNALYQLADDLNRTESLEQVFDPALDAIINAIECDRASILLYDESQLMRFVAWRGLSDAYRKATDGHSPWTPDTGNPEPISMDDVRTADLGQELRTVIENEGIGALAFIPLVSAGKLIGKFMVYFNAPHTFTEDELDFSLTIANQLASSIDRKRAQDDLRLSEHKFSSIFQSAPFAIALQRLPDTRFADVNHAFVELFGYSREELIGKTSLEVGLQQDSDLTEETLQQYEKQRFMRNVELQLMTKSGQPIWVSTSAEPVVIAGKEYILTMAVDITARRQAEEAMRGSEALYRMIARSIPDGGVYVVDKDFRYLVAEGPVTEAFGLTREMLEGKTVMEAFPDERGKRMEERLQRTFTGETVHFETRFNDRVYWTQQAPLMHSIGQAIILTLDITERKLAEEAIAVDLHNTQLLRELAARFVTEGDLLVIYQEFIQAAMTISHAEAGTVQLIDQESGDLILIATQGLPQDLVEHFQRVKAGSGTSCGMALATGERSLVVFDDPRNEDPDGSLRIHREAGLRSAQSTPLVTRSGKPIGMISTHWRRHYRPSERELRYLDLLARQATDLLEQRLAEEALRQSEERFTQFMQHLPGLAWIKDVQGHYVYANPAAAKVFGAVHKEIYGKTDEEIFPEDIAAQFRKNDQQALQGKKGIQAVETLQHEDDVLHYSLVSKFPIPGPDGSPALIGGTAFDITERIQMEDALKGAREKAEESAYRIARLQKVTAALSEFLTPTQVAKVVVDQGAPALGAVSSSMMVLSEDGQHLEIKYSASPEAVIRPYTSFPISLNVPAADAVRSGQPVWIESRDKYLELYPHLAEQIHQWGHQAALAIPMNYKGRTLGVLTMSFDRPMPHTPDDQAYALTLARQGGQALERARAEEALRESEERHRAILSQATAGIVRKDAKGRLMFVNQAFCNMLDMLDTELLGRTMWELTHEEDVDENRRLFKRLMKEGIPFQLDKRLIRKDSSILWVNVSVSPVMDASGKPHSAVSVYMDVTRHKRAENRLALLTKVSELSRQLEEPEELLFAVAREVGEHFHVRRSLFNEVDLEKDRVVVHRDYVRGGDSWAGIHKVSEYSNEMAVTMMAGRTVVNKDAKLDPRTALNFESFYAERGERAYIAVPLMHEDTWVASLRISDDRPREWDVEDIQLLEAIAERTWTAAEKMRINRALRDSEERLRVTFNTTAVGFAMLNPETRFVDVNDAFCEIVGYTREELLGMNINHLTHPGYLKSTRDHIDRLLAGEVPSFTVEKLYIRGDGAEIWVQKNMSLVRDVDGSTQHLIVICQDVTERKRVEEELRQLNLELEERVLNRTAELQSAYEFLRESEATSRLILESMPDAIVIADRDGKIVHANTQVESLFGYSPKEVLGQQMEMLLPERFRDQHIKNRETYTGQRSRRIMGLGLDLYGRRKDKSEFPVDVMLSPIDNNTAWDVMVSIRDNTKQREAQEALRTNEEKLRTLFEILPAGVSFLDKEGKINDMNSALTEILGLSKKELMRSSYASRQYIRADGTPMPQSEFASRRAVEEQKTINNVETGIVKENGDIVWTSVNAAPVQIADVEVAVVTIDITERKKAEEALHRHRERLRVLSRRLVEVQEEERRTIARELHDRVGQNLAALTLNLNILRSQLSGEVLERIGTRLNDSVNLVNDILTITRSVMADLRPNVLDDYGLDAAINEYGDRFSQRYGIRVLLHSLAKPIPRLDASVEMTLLRITQEALTNIARHAQASQAVISLEVKNNAIHMAVEDDGIGILSWQKVNQSGSHGLRIMRERAEAFGGSLKVHSSYKKGTRIEVIIPLGSSTHKQNSQEKRS